MFLNEKKNDSKGILIQFGVFVVCMWGEGRIKLNILCMYISTIYSKQGRSVALSSRKLAIGRKF